MRILYPTEQNTWIVEVSKEEMKKLDPGVDDDWMVVFRENVQLLNLSVRSRHAMLKALRLSINDYIFIRCFKKNGVTLSFEEWASQPDLSVRLQSINGIGPGTANEIIGEIRSRIVLV